MTKKVKDTLGTVGKDEAKFISKGEVIPLKAFAPEDQTLYLPLLKIRDKNLVHLLKEKVPLEHVVYNNTLYLLIGESSVTIESPSFGDTTVRYLDDKTPEPIYSAAVVLYHSTIKMLTDGKIRGHNCLSYSSICGKGACFTLDDAICNDAIINADMISIINSSLVSCLFDTEYLLVNNSRCNSMTIATGGNINIQSSPHLYNFTIGGYGEGKEKRGLRDVLIRAPIFLQGEDNPFNVNFGTLKSGEDLKITIESRMDFSPMTAINGKTFSTARAGNLGIIVGGLFIDQDHDGIDLDDDDTEQLTELLFDRVIPEKELSYVQETILEDFVASIESRLAVYKAIGSDLI